MGAWGAGPLENDGAGDLLASIRHGDFSFEEIAWAFEDSDYLEVDGGQIAITLAHLVVAGREGTAVPGLDDVGPFLAQVTPERVAWIRAQVGLTLAGGETSELYELWEETDELDAWVAEARTLLARLA